jgi:hypothetical protein
MWGGRSLLCATLATTIFGVVTACTFTTGVSDLQNGNCGVGQKACPNPQTSVMACVGLDQPQYGCSQMGCTPCSRSNATTRCDMTNNCAVAVCMTGYAHCDSNPLDGCEAAIFSDPTNCGQDPSTACGHHCNLDINGKPNVTDNAAACVNGVCQIGGCSNGYQDCDKNIANGCECPPSGSCTLTGGCATDAGAGPG